MRWIHCKTVAAACLVLLMTASPLMAKDKKENKPMDPQAMMELWKKLATPGELDDHHQGVDGTRQAPNGIDRHRRDEDVAGRALSLPGIQCPDDGTTLFRGRHRRL